MRHPRSLPRAIAHPAGGTRRRRFVPSPSPLHGKPGGPPPARSLRERDPASARPAAAKADRVILTLAGASAAAGIVSLFTESGTPDGLVLGAALLVTGGLLRWPRAARRALAALTATALLPTLLLIALAVRLSGPGPVLVRQEGSGGDGPPDGVLRFRTTIGAGARNGRTTRVGRMLRVLGLDALPVLLDVARGAPLVLHVDPSPTPVCDGSTTMSPDAPCGRSGGRPPRR